MNPQFVNDGQAVAFLNSGTSEGAQKAWESRGTKSKIGEEADKQSEIAFATKGHIPAMAEHEKAVQMHEAARFEAAQRGDEKEKAYHYEKVKEHKRAYSKHRSDDYWEFATGKQDHGIIP